MDISEKFDPPANPGRKMRKEGRFRTFKAGVVVINNNNSTISCTIRNQSFSGARLRIEGAFQPPAIFTLRAPGDNWQTECEVVWRKDGEIGVRFLSGRPSLNAAPN